MGTITVARALGLCLALGHAPGGQADTRQEILRNSRAAMERLLGQNEALAGLVSRGAGVLVFPEVVRLGFGEGGHYGEGVLLIAGEPVAYYAATGTCPVSCAEVPAGRLLLFMSRDALVSFRNTANWQAGVHSNVIPLQIAPRGGVADPGATASARAGSQPAAAEPAAPEPAAPEPAAPILAVGFGASGPRSSLCDTGGVINRIAR